MTLAMPMPDGTTTPVSDEVDAALGALMRAARDWGSAASRRPEGTRRGRQGPLGDVYQAQALAVLHDALLPALGRMLDERARLVVSAAIDVDALARAALDDAVADWSAATRRRLEHGR